MNKYIAQGDGFPADNEFLMLIQSIIGEVAQLTSLGGTSYILKGCEVSNGIIADGWLVLDGEVVPFISGAEDTQVTIDESIEYATHLEDVDADGIGDSKPTYFTRSARSGSGGTATYLWSDLERITPLTELKKAIVPLNCPIMYVGDVNDIPDGWELYSIIKGRVPVGYDPSDEDFDVIGATGGSKTHQLTIAEMPQHNLTGSITVPAHTHTTTGYSKSSQSVDNGSGSVVADSAGSSSPTGSGGGGTYGFTTNNKGGDQAHNIMQPYIVTAYIIRTAV